MLFLLYLEYFFRERDSRRFEKILPDSVFWAGGPEVSFDAEDFLKKNPGFFGVMVGEGEETFRELCRFYVDKKGSLEEIPGIAFGCGENPT